MPASVVQICNTALARVGVSQSIDSLTEATAQASVCNLFFEQVRDRALQDFPWPFARKYLALALVEEEPNDDWNYSYRYPTDCLKVRRLVTGAGRIEAEPSPFEVGHDDDGRLIYTDEAEAVAEYTARMTDPSRYDPAFASALAWLLASEIALPLSVSNGLRAEAQRGYAVELSAASAIAANEHRRTPDPESDFIRARE